MANEIEQVEQIEQKKFPVYGDTGVQKSFRLRRYAVMILTIVAVCGGIFWIVTSTLGLGGASAAAVRPTATVQLKETPTIVIPQVVQKLQTVIVVREVTSVPTITPIPTQTPYIIYKSVTLPTYTPFPTSTPFVLNGIYFDNGCLVVSIWNVKEVYINGQSAVGGERYCDVQSFRVVVK